MKEVHTEKDNLQLFYGLVIKLKEIKTLKSQNVDVSDMLSEIEREVLGLKETFNEKDNKTKADDMLNDIYYMQNDYKIKASFKCLTPEIIKKAEDALGKPNSYSGILEPESRSSNYTYSAYLIGESTAKGALIGAFVGGCVTGAIPAATGYLAGGTLCCLSTAATANYDGMEYAAKLGAGILGVPSTIPGGIVGGVLGSLPGLMHGFFRAATRKPLDKDEQGNLVDCLKHFLNVDENQKNRIILKIVWKYKKTQSCATSNSSVVLFETLQNDKISVEKKWESINSYMLETFKYSDSLKNDLLKNNGKKLFMIIYDEMKDDKRVKVSQDEKSSLLNPLVAM